MHILPSRDESATSPLYSTSEGSEVQDLPCAQSARAAFDVGLVYSKTSGVSGSGIEVDVQASRLKRLRCSVLTAARLHIAQRQGWRCCMATLTYAPEHDWQPYQITHYCKSVREYLKRLGYESPSVWVQEFTKKGRPHYHVLHWLPLGVELLKPDDAGWWTWGFSRIEWVRNAVGYIAKYASKGSSLHRPAKGARMYGILGLTGSALQEARWWRMPKWVRDCVPMAELFQRVRGGVVALESGEFYACPWQVVFCSGKIFLQQVVHAPPQRTELFSGVML